MRRMARSLHNTSLTIGLTLGPGVRDAIQTMERFAATMRDLERTTRRR